MRPREKRPCVRSDVQKARGAPSQRHSPRHAETANPASASARPPPRPRRRLLPLSPERIFRYARRSRILREKHETMHRYRTHHCGDLRQADDGQAIRLSGWCHRIRDHGGVLFIDLRDHYGLTQCVVDPDSPAFKQAEKLRSEFVVRIDGDVRKRPAGTENAEMPTGPDRGLRPRDRSARPRRRSAAAGVRRSALSRGHAAQISLPRSAPRQAASEHHAARARHRFACARG